MKEQLLLTRDNRRIGNRGKRHFSSLNQVRLDILTWLSDVGNLSLLLSKLLKEENGDAPR